MVSTIDGKTVTGERTEPVGDLGSKVDHEIMRRIEAAADAVMLGAGSLRSTPGLWYPKDKWRIVVTRSGNLPYDVRFFTDAPEKAIVIGPPDLQVPAPIRHIENSGFAEALSELKGLGIHHLLVEGGSELNAELLSHDLVDELFLTVAPKVKLGRSTPTYAGGEPLPRDQIRDFSLVEHHVVADEVFLRYRRAQ